jgi:hypothetical protein
MRAAPDGGVSRRGAPEAIVSAGEPTAMVGIAAAEILTVVVCSRALVRRPESVARTATVATVSGRTWRTAERRSGFPDR